MPCVHHFILMEAFSKHIKIILLGACGFTLKTSG